MIHYQLVCAEDHPFDGWFKDSAGFDAQAARGLVECPQCGDARVRRALMAPALGKAATPPRPPTPAASAPIRTTAHLPDHLRAALQRLRSEVERQCDYVGPAFAEEARRIHAGEADARGIYGETTPEQAEALAEDGIDVARIPWLERADS